MNNNEDERKEEIRTCGPTAAKPAPDGTLTWREKQFHGKSFYIGLNIIGRQVSQNNNVKICII